MTLSQRNLAKRLKYKLPCIKLCLILERSKPDKVFLVKTPEDVAELCNPLRHLPEEHFISLHLNAKHEVIGFHEVSHGTLSASLVHPREVFKAALLSNSYAILLCHNHPSGSVIEPSTEDIDTTAKLLHAGNLLSIHIIDHVIVGPNQAIYSMRESHPQLWQ